MTGLELTHASEFAGRQSFYQPIDEPETDNILAEYVRFLDRRNGVMDLDRFAFSKRETHMAELGTSSVRYDGPFDEALFFRQYDQYDRSVPTDWVTKLLLLLSKVNAAEEYAVDVMRESRRRRHESGARHAFLEKVALTEEEYHTRLLVGAGQYFGVDVQEMPKVRPMLRLKIAALAHVPGRLFNSVILASEGVALYTVNAVLQATRRILKDHPAVRDAIEERIFNVMIDEIGHVTFNRYASGPLGVSFARSIYPLVKHGFSIGPEYREICAYVADDLPPISEFDLGHLPEEVRNRGFFA
jgi:hypothetical protein